MFRFILIIVMLLFFQSNKAQAIGDYLNFHNFSSNKGAGTAPKGSSAWQYSSGVTNNFPANNESFGAGWLTNSILSDGLHWFWIDDKDSLYQCTSHGTISTFNYLDVTPSGRNGNALRNVITGGYTADPICTVDGVIVSGSAGQGPNGGPRCGCPSYGTQLFNRESFTGPSQIYTAGTLGNSYLYFHRINTTGAGAQRVTTPYNAVAGANRMYVYVYQPSCASNGSSNGTANISQVLQETYEFGLFLDGNSTAEHQYFNFYTQGGGWAKMQVEETTNGDNNGDQATRYIPGMIQGNGSTQSIPNNNSTGLWQFYLTTLPVSLPCTPPYQILIDDIAFDNDTYTPQNQTTISNIAVMYNDTSKTWEISFNDEYKNAYAYSTYQVKYSTSSPITNENWNSATPVNILPSGTFGIAARSDGLFQKWNPNYQGVWAPFNLSSGDAAALSAGQTVYFAVLDVSQQGCPLNPSGITGITTGSACTQTPNDTIITVGYPYGPAPGITYGPGNGHGGRQYATYPKLFDWTDDQNNLPYIKRISYTLSTNWKPLPPNNLQLINSK